MYTIVKTEVNQPYLRGYILIPYFPYDFRDAWLDLPIQSQSALRQRDHETAVAIAAALQRGAP